MSKPRSGKLGALNEDDDNDEDEDEDDVNRIYSKFKDFVEVDQRASKFHFHSYL